MTRDDYRTFAAALAFAAVVCLTATVWATSDLLSQPLTWPNAATVAFGVVATTLLTAGAMRFRSMAQNGGQS